MEHLLCSAFFLYALLGRVLRLFFFEGETGRSALISGDSEAVFVETRWGVWGEGCLGRAAWGGLLGVVVFCRVAWRMLQIWFDRLVLSVLLDLLLPGCVVRSA